MGLLVPVDGAKIEYFGTPSEGSFVQLPAAFHTGIEVVDKQHQCLVELVAQLDKAFAPSVKERLKALDRSKRGWLGILFKRFFS